MVPGQLLLILLPLFSVFLTVTDNCLNRISSMDKIYIKGHVEHSSGAVRTACDIQIEGRQGAGRPKLTWKKLMEKVCRE